MRAMYATLATTLMVLAFAGALTALYVLVIAGIMGMVRPSDIGMRAALVGETMPKEHLMGAMGIQRTTQDSARIAGALTGAGLVAMLGMGPAYAMVAALYTISTVLTLQTGRGPGPRSRGAAAGGASARPSPWRDLRQGIGYVWATPHVRSMMYLALMLNMTAFPLMNGLMPYAAKEVFHADQTWLGYMVATAGAGAILGSMILSRYGRLVRPTRMTIGFSVAWLAMLLLFAQQTHPVAGLVVLLLAGCAQALSITPMLAMLLRTTDERYRGRVMGIRMLAIYGNIPGLLLSGPLIARLNYPMTALLYCAAGIAVTAFITLRWRSHLWLTSAPANRRG